jgi:hypothetical protein
VKGDANYRRLIDDRLWPHDTPLVTAWGYLPAPLVALRTLKSEVCVGLAAGVSVCGRAETNAWLLTRGVGQERLSASDADWLVRGGCCLIACQRKH